MGDVLSMKRKPVELQLMNGKNHETQSSVFLVFNRGLTESEFKFFFEICERAAFLMRTMES